MLPDLVLLPLKELELGTSHRNKTQESLSQSDIHSWLTYMLQVQRLCLFQCACSVFIADCHSSNVVRDKYVGFFFIDSERYYCKSLSSSSSVTKRDGFSQFFLTAQCFQAVKKCFLKTLQFRWCSVSFLFRLPSQISVLMVSVLFFSSWLFL